LENNPANSDFDSKGPAFTTSRMDTASHLPCAAVRRPGQAVNCRASGGKWPMAGTIAFAVGTCGAFWTAVAVAVVHFTK
jgi:hypothetical protein